MPATIFGLAWAKPLLTVRMSAMTSRLRLETSILALPCEPSITSSVLGDQPTRLLALELVGIGVAGGEGVFVEHHPDLLRRGPGVEVAQHLHAQPGLLRQIAQEELALVELRA